MSQPIEKATGDYEGRSFRDPDDGSGAACSVGGERMFALDLESVPDVLVSNSYIAELRRAG